MTLVYRVFLAGYAAFFTYIVLGLVFGSMGFAEIKRLRAYQKLLDKNLTELEALHDELEGRAMSLRSDKDTLMVQSRDIGYLAPGEGLILLEEYGREYSPYPMGKMLKWTRKVETRRPLFRGIALSVGIVFFHFFGFVSPKSIL